MTSKRRKPAGKRPENPTTLLVVQGAVTEKEYFERLRRRYRLSGLKVGTESHSAEKIVGKVKYNLANDKDAPYSDVFFVVDVDESGSGQLEQGISHAKRQSTRRTRCSFVISNECFEVWLLAHFEDLKGRSMSRSTLTAKLRAHGALLPDSDKDIAQDFPIDAYAKAKANVAAAEFDRVGPNASTAVARLVSHLVPGK